MDSTADERALERWFSVVESRTRRRRLIDRTITNDRSGILTLPVRFFVKVVEVGPARAVKIAVSVVRDRLAPR